MKSLLLAAGLCLGGVAAQARTVTYVYFEEEFTGYSMLSTLDGEELGPFLPSTLGPFWITVSFDAEQIPYLGENTTDLRIYRGAEVDDSDVGWRISGSKNIDYDGWAATDVEFAASLGSYRNLTSSRAYGVSALDMTVDLTGKVTDWHFWIEEGIPNGAIYGGSGSPSRFSFSYAYLSTETEEGRRVSAGYKGIGQGYWTRFGGDEIFAAPVPLPASGLLLMGALSGLAGVPRFRRTRQSHTSA